VAFGIVVLKTWDERTRPDQQLDTLVGQAMGRLSAISSANIFAFAPPPIQGLGITGGFDFRLQAIEDQPPREIAAVTRAMLIAANQDPALMQVFSTYTADTPQIFVNLDRTRAETLKVPVSRVFATLQEQLGSGYVNDFNLYGRTYQVKVQADASYRNAVDDISSLYVRSNDGKMVPMRSLVTLSTVLRIAARTLPDGYSFDWSSMSFQERKAGGKVAVLFVLALLFCYLFLVGQYESWNIPLSIILSVPVASLGGLAGLGCQKRHSDCGVCQRPPGTGIVRLQSSHRGCTNPLQASVDDSPYLYPGRCSNGDSHRSRSRQPPGHRHHGFFREKGSAWRAKRREKTAAKATDKA